MQLHVPPCDYAQCHSFGDAEEKCNYDSGLRDTDGHYLGQPELHLPCSVRADPHDDVDWPQQQESQPTSQKSTSQRLPLSQLAHSQLGIEGRHTGECAEIDSVKCYPKAKVPRLAEAPLATPCALSCAASRVCKGGLQGAPGDTSVALEVQLTNNSCTSRCDAVPPFSGFYCADADPNHQNPKSNHSQHGGTMTSAQLAQPQKLLQPDLQFGASLSRSSFSALPKHGKQLLQSNVDQVARRDP